MVAQKLAEHVRSLIYGKFQTIISQNREWLVNLNSFYYDMFIEDKLLLGPHREGVEVKTCLQNQAGLNFFSKNDREIETVVLDAIKKRNFAFGLFAKW